MRSPLIDIILANARRAGVPLTVERAGQIALAAQPRYDAFANVRASIAFDDAPSFESALLANRSTMQAAP